MSGARGGQRGFVLSPRDTQGNTRDKQKAAAYAVQLSSPRKPALLPHSLRFRAVPCAAPDAPAGLHRRLMLREGQQKQEGDRD